MPPYPRDLVWPLAILLGLGLAPGAVADTGGERLRGLGIRIGTLEPGPLDAITDVPGVRVGHVTLRVGEGRLVPGKGPVRSGVTAIVPRADIWHHKCFAGTFVLNGNGEMTGTHWVREAGFLETPILLTDTLNVPRVANGVISWMAMGNPDMGIEDDVVLPVVAECDDSFLNDSRGRHVSEADTMRAIDSAAGGPVAEGSVGAGTGMVAFRFKAGIGTASRKVAGGYTVGVLVNANMAPREELRIDGVPVGREITDLMPIRKPSEGSIIVIVGTDAPLLPHQLDRVARRAAAGIARTGSTIHNSSGDLILAFSTGNEVPHYPDAATMSLVAMDAYHLDPIFQGAVEATEEAIGNALVAARDTTGRDGHKAFALPHDRLKAVMRRYGR